MTESAQGLALRFSGPVSSLSEACRTALAARTSIAAASETPAAVSRIIADVRQRRDEALREMAWTLDGVRLDSLEVPPERIDDAVNSLNSNVRKSLERSAANLQRVHRSQLPEASELIVEPGVVVGRRPDPLERVGVYAPGGRAAYPSSVLMGAVPARVAGVQQVILCSPPGSNGLPSDVVLAASRIAGVDQVFSIGGAGAIAAMALGTGTVPRVDRIVGPGNAYVAEAKLQLSGVTSFDSPAGPSELVIITDSTALPEAIAREVVAQAEHDPRAVVVVIAIGEQTAHSIRLALAPAVRGAARREIVTASLAQNGGIVSVDSAEEAIALASDFAPEHLLLATCDADRLLPMARNAGTIFVGQTSSVSFGDYMTGANHVLPTGGLARSYSGLSTLDFIRWTTYQRIDAIGAASLAEPVGILADAEGLFGHADAARGWGQP